MNVSKRKIHTAMKRKNQSKKKYKRRRHKTHSNSAKHKKNTNLLFKTIKQYHKKHLVKHKLRKYYGGKLNADDEAALKLEKEREQQSKALAAKTNQNVITPSTNVTPPANEANVQTATLITNNNISTHHDDTTKLNIMENKKRSTRQAITSLEKDMKLNGVPYAFYSNKNAAILLHRNVANFDRLLILDDNQLNELYKVLQVSDVTKNRTNTAIKNAKEKANEKENAQPKTQNKNTGQLKQLLKEKLELEQKNKELNDNLHYLNNQMKKGETTCFNTTNNKGKLIRICVEDDKSFKHWLNHAVHPTEPTRITTTKNLKISAEELTDPKKGKDKPKQGKDKPKQGKDKTKQGKDKPKQGKDKTKQGKDKPKQGKDKTKT